MYDGPMRGLTHRWIEPEGLPKDGDGGDWSRSGLEPLVRRVLAARGISGPDEAGRFCAPSLLEMHDPSLMHDLDDAAQRLLDALSAGERVVIYGDYDVDGVSATTILWQTLSHVDPDAIGEGRVLAYVPHRLDEGYVFNAEALRGFADDVVTVVVSVDRFSPRFETTYSRSAPAAQPGEVRNSVNASSVMKNRTWLYCCAPI